eukprot:736538-Heterocapsa_arctica.AAC.1
MQTIDGDEFILEKECIRLLYCNKIKWGDTGNHYDRMQPMIQQICKGKLTLEEARFNILSTGSMRI